MNLLRSQRSLTIVEPNLYKLDESSWRWGPVLMPDEFKDPHADDSGSGLYMDMDFMDKLHGLRMLVGSSMTITPNGGFSSTGHATGCAHYFGLAADIQFPKADLSEVSNFIRQSSFNGVGFYPFWNTPGFHVDTLSRRARWIRIKNGSYVSLT